MQGHCRSAQLLLQCRPFIFHILLPDLLQRVLPRGAHRVCAADGLLLPVPGHRTPRVPQCRPEALPTHPAGAAVLRLRRTRHHGVLGADLDRRRARYRADPGLLRGLPLLHTHGTATATASDDSVTASS